MGIIALEGLLVALMALGSATIIWGVRRFNLPSSITTIAFATTAVSWVAFLVVTIAFIVGALVLPSA